MNISVKTLKGLMIKELESHYSSACQNLHNDIQRNFVHIGKMYLTSELEKCESYDDLENWLSIADYRMSLQEWIDSL